MFGPILLAVLIWMAWCALRHGCEELQCRLLVFSIPVIFLLTSIAVILLLTLQALVITLAPIFAPKLTEITGPDWNRYARVLGWRDLAAATRRAAESQATDNHEVTGELLYYLRDTSLPVLIWWRGEPPRNYVEMAHPFTASAPEPLLYVTLNRAKTSVPTHFSTADVLEKLSFPSDGAPVRGGALLPLAWL